MDHKGKPWIKAEVRHILWFSIHGTRMFAYLTAPLPKRALCEVVRVISSLCSEHQDCLHLIQSCWQNIPIFILAMFVLLGKISVLDGRTKVRSQTNEVKQQDSCYFFEIALIICRTISSSATSESNSTFIWNAAPINLRTANLKFLIPANLFFPPSKSIEHLATVSVIVRSIFDRLTNMGGNRGYSSSSSIFFLHHHPSFISFSTQAY